MVCSILIQLFFFGQRGLAGWLWDTANLAGAFCMSSLALATSSLTGQWPEWVQLALDPIQQAGEKLPQKPEVRLLGLEPLHGGEELDFQLAKDGWQW